jgi:hypothetical protein
MAAYEPNPEKHLRRIHFRKNPGHGALLPLPPLDDATKEGDLTPAMKELAEKYLRRLYFRNKSKK